jgi:hypothetical protein
VTPTSSERHGQCSVQADRALQYSTPELHAAISIYRDYSHRHVQLGNTSRGLCVAKLLRVFGRQLLLDAILLLQSGHERNVLLLSIGGRYLRVYDLLPGLVLLLALFVSSISALLLSSLCAWENGGGRRTTKSNMPGAGRDLMSTPSATFARP